LGRRIERRRLLRCLWRAGLTGPELWSAKFLGYQQAPNQQLIDLQPTNSSAANRESTNRDCADGDGTDCNCAQRKATNCKRAACEST